MPGVKRIYGSPVSLNEAASVCVSALDSVSPASLQLTSQTRVVNGKDDSITGEHYVANASTSTSLPYLRGGLTPSAETSSVGPVRNPEVPEGYHNLLEALV